MARRRGGGKTRGALTILVLLLSPSCRAVSGNGVQAEGPTVDASHRSSKENTPPRGATEASSSPKQQQLRRSRDQVLSRSTPPASADLVRTGDRHVGHARKLEYELVGEDDDDKSCTESGDGSGNNGAARPAVMPPFLQPLTCPPPPDHLEMNALGGCSLSDVRVLGHHGGDAASGTDTDIADVRGSPGRRGEHVEDTSAAPAEDGGSHSAFHAQGPSASEEPHEQDSAGDVETVEVLDSPSKQQQQQQRQQRRPLEEGGIIGAKGTGSIVGDWDVDDETTRAVGVPDVGHEKPPPPTKTRFGWFRKGGRDPKRRGGPESSHEEVRTVGASVPHLLEPSAWCTRDGCLPPMREGAVGSGDVGGSESGGNLDAKKSSSHSVPDEATTRVAAHADGTDVECSTSVDERCHSLLAKPPEGGDWSVAHGRELTVQDASPEQAPVDRRCRYGLSSDAARELGADVHDSVSNDGPLPENREDGSPRRRVPNALGQERRGPVVKAVGMAVEDTPRDHSIHSVSSTPKNDDLPEELVVDQRHRDRVPPRKRRTSRSDIHLDGGGVFDPEKPLAGDRMRPYGASLACAAVLFVIFMVAYVQGMLPHWVPFVGGNPQEGWALDLDDAIATARSRAGSFCTGRASLVSEGVDENGVPDLVAEDGTVGASEPASSGRGMGAASLKSGGSSGGNAYDDERGGLMWDTRPKAFEHLVYDPVFGVVPWGVLNAWASPGGNGGTNRWQSRPPAAAPAAGACGEPPLGASRGSVVDPAGRRRSKRARPPVRYTEEWHAWRDERRVARGCIEAEADGGRQLDISADAGKDSEQGVEAAVGEQEGGTNGQAVRAEEASTPDGVPRKATPSSTDRRALVAMSFRSDRFSRKKDIQSLAERPALGGYEDRDRGERDGMHEATAQELHREVHASGVPPRLSPASAPLAPPALRT